MLIYPQWVSLPLSTRQGLAKQFGVAKTRSTHVIDNQVADDGYRIADLDGAFTTEAIQEYVGTKETDPIALWNLMVAKFKESIEPVVVDTTEPDPRTVEVSMATPEKIKVIKTEEPKKKGQPAKK